MNSLELTSFITAVANIIAQNVSDNDVLGLLGAIATQLGDTLTTISAQRALCDNINENKSSDNKTITATSDKL